MYLLTFYPRALLFLRQVPKRFDTDTIRSDQGVPDTECQMFDYRLRAAR